MTHTSKPDREVVRSWMRERQVERVPPPSPEEVRRQLGWHMVEPEREMTNMSKR